MSLRFAFLFCLLPGLTPLFSSARAPLAAPRITVTYSPQDLTPTVSIRSSAGAVVRYTTDGSAVTVTSPVFKMPFSPTAPCRIRAKAFQAKRKSSKESTDTIQKYELLVATTFIQKPAAGIRTTYSPDSKPVEENSQWLVRNEIVLEGVCPTRSCRQTWQGYIDIAATGGYQFWTKSDDGSMFIIDHQTMVDNSGNHALRERSGLAYLQKGWHSLQIEYDNSGGPGSLEVYFAPVGGTKANIPAKMLAH